MKYVGVDACSSGWFAGIVNDGLLKTTHYCEFSELYEEHNGAERILVDIPIGVPEAERRDCEVEAKKLLGCRGVSVFYPPCRAVVDENPDDYERANELHRKEIDNGLSQQAFHILSKIKEVDEAISAEGVEGGNVLESHPELCFYAFNDGNPIAYSKKSEPGREKRRKLLRQVLDGADQAYENAMNEHYRKDVARDDIVDTLVLTAAARADTLVSVPNDRTHERQRKVMVYPKLN